MLLGSQLFVYVCCMDVMCSVRIGMHPTLHMTSVSTGLISETYMQQVWQQVPTAMLLRCDV
jgi:hypothetical protein